MSDRDACGMANIYLSFKDRESYVFSAAEEEEVVEGETPKREEVCICVCVCWGWGNKNAEGTTQTLW